MNLPKVLSLVLVASLTVATSWACDTGRIYLGTINETHPLHLDKNGLYLEQADQLDGYPLYKHQYRELYLYHVSGAILSASFWVVGTIPGSLAVTLSIQTSADSPDLSNEKWRLWDDVRGAWVVERHLKATCVDESFGRCEDDVVYLHGLSAWSAHQASRSGMYSMTEEMHDFRPVYQHQDSHGRTNYLYYRSGFWMVGPAVGRVSGAMFAVDYAWRPELIVEDWIVFNGHKFQRDPRIRITCSEDEEEELASDTPLTPGDTNFDLDDLLTVEEGTLRDDGGELTSCSPSYCRHGGTCITDGDERLCLCQDGFQGDICERPVSCLDDLEEIENGRVMSKTGSRYHDTAFYECDADYLPVGHTAVRCLASGHWEAPPSCVSWLDMISPGVPSRQRRHYRRRRLHSRDFRINQNDN